MNAGVEEAGKKVVAEDPGLKAKQDAIYKKVQEFAQQEQIIHTKLNLNLYRRVML